MYARLAFSKSPPFILLFFLFGLGGKVILSCNFLLSSLLAHLYLAHIEVSTQSLSLTSDSNSLATYIVLYEATLNPLSSNLCLNKSAELIR